MLHLRDHRDERAVHQFVDATGAFVRDAALEQPPQAKRDVGILRRIFSRLVERDFGEADLALAGAADVLEADACVPQVNLRRLVHAVACQALPRIEVEAHDDGVVIGGDLYPVAAQDGDVIFEVLADLEDAVVLQQRFQSGEDEIPGKLFGLLREHVLAAMADRNVAGGVGTDGEADAHQRAGHAVEHVRLRIDGDQPLGPGGGDPAVERVFRHHRFIEAAVDGRFFLQHRGGGGGVFGDGGGCGRDRHGRGGAPARASSDLKP